MQMAGFYTGKSISQVFDCFLTKELVLEFELGLELDSAEVRGILLYNNQEWGRFASQTSGSVCIYINVAFNRVTFDFLG